MEPQTYYAEHLHILTIQHQTQLIYMVIIACFYQSRIQPKFKF